MMMCVCLCICNVCAAQPAMLTLQIDNPYMEAYGTLVEIDPGRGTSPIVVDGRTLVPVRAIVERIGGTVAWEQSTSTATLVYGATTIDLTPGSTAAYVNGEQHTLDVAPAIINGRTMLPIRFIAEKFGFDVQWMPDSSKIVISTAADSKGLLAVHYIDVGQGDSAFVQLPDGKILLIDAGPSTDVVNRYVSALGCKKIDFIVATHPDADHIGGMPQVLDEFEVGDFYMPDKAHTTRLFENMLDSLDANGCSVNVAESGVVVAVGDGYNVEIVAPVAEYEDNNNSSAVVVVECGDVSFLFTGDIENQAETDILNSGADIDADVLKIAHHGSDSSTSETFLDAVTPKLAVVSVGADNKYGHPSIEVVSRLNARYIPYYSTAKLGTVVIECDGMSCNVITSEAVSDNDTQVQAVPQNIYRTATGKKYHMDGCPSLKSKIQTTLEDAKAAGLEPCSKCNPPH